MLEFGAGSGVMAADLLAELDVLDALPQRYLILELPACSRPSWRPFVNGAAAAGACRMAATHARAGFQAVVLGNELLDAMPVQQPVAMRVPGRNCRWASGTMVCVITGMTCTARGLAEALAQIWPDAQGVERAIARKSICVLPRGCRRSHRAYRVAMSS